MDQSNGNEPEDGEAVMATSEDENVDDPLSEIWAQAEDESAMITPPPTTDNQYVEIRTMSGTYKVDMAPPEVQLKNASVNVDYLYRKRMADECLREAIRQLTLTRIVDGDTKPWNDILSGYPEQTMEHASHAQRLLSFPNRSLEKPDKLEILDTALLSTFLRGRALLARKKFEEAAEELQKAERLLEERHRQGEMKDKSFWVTEIATAMARIRIFENDTNDALRYLRKVDKLMQKKYGSEDPKMIPLYQEMSKLEENLGRIDTAIELRIKAYTISKASFDQRNPQIGDAALELARVYSKAPVEDADVYSESYFIEAVTNYSESQGHTDPKTLIAQQELATEISRLDRKPDAIALLSRCLRELTVVGEEYDSKTAKIYKQLAGLCAETGRNRQAVQVLKKSLQVEEMHYGPNSRKVQETKDALAALSKNINGRGQSLDTRPRFSATVRTSTIEGGRKYSWDN